MELSDEPISLTLHVGNGLSPASNDLSVDLDTVEIIERVDGPSVFSLSFNVDPPLESDEYAVVGQSALAPFARLGISVKLGNDKQTLADGFITRQELMPPTSHESGSFVIYCEDVGVMMDLEEKSVEYVNLDYAGVARRILNGYGQYATADVKTPKSQDPTDTLRKTRLQHGTDRAYLSAIAQMVGHIFYVKPGPAVGKNTAYWGPPDLSGSADIELASSLLIFSPASRMHLGYRALSATKTSGSVVDLSSSPSNTQEVNLTSATRSTLSSSPGLTAQKHIRKRLIPHSGMSVARAQLLGQSMIDNSVDRVAFASVKVDTLALGTMVRAATLVELTGVGKQYGGKWFVRQVTHALGRGRFEQQIELSRDGLGR